MKALMIASALCAALLFAAVSSVSAETSSDPLADTVTPVVLIGE